MKHATERFRAFVDVAQAHGCDLWIGQKNRAGYGKFSYRGKTVFAHRFAFILSGRKLSLDQHVLHSCDTPACVNPLHLRAGNHAENMRDRSDRNRTYRPFGNKHAIGNTVNLGRKLSPEHKAQISKMLQGNTNAKGTKLATRIAAFKATIARRKR